VRDLAGAGRSEIVTPKVPKGRDQINNFGLAGKDKSTTSYSMARIEDFASPSTLAKCRIVRCQALFVGKE
jgi:hypothetical protein